MYGYAHWSVSPCGLYKARTGVIWSFEALQGNIVYSPHLPTHPENNDLENGLKYLYGSKIFKE